MNDIPIINHDGSEFPYLHRDISWLDFNYRVLQEAKDPSVPLFERIKFLAIYSNNLDEFFRVRVASNRNLILVGKKTRKQIEYDPSEIQAKIVEIVNRQQEEFTRIFIEQIIPELQQQNIFLVSTENLTQEQDDFLQQYFEDNLLPFVQPVLLIKDKIRPFLNNAALYLVVRLKDKLKDNGRYRYGVVKIPSDHLSRFVELPSDDHRKYIIMLDDIVRRTIHHLFPGYDIQDSFSIKLSRDAELYIDDEFSGDLVAKIRRSLNKRSVGPPSRFVYDREMPQNMLEFITKVLDVQNFDLFREGRYHNNFDFFSFPDYNMNHLKNNPLPPLPYYPLEDADNIFEKIKKKDHLLHVPYQSYESVIRWFEDAAADPAVTHIKIVQYRVARESRIMRALMDAVKAGKQVSVFIEVKARFDEEANLKWGEILEQVGINVIYSFPGLKVHSKIALVRRIENSGAKIYTYLGTGNFHEGTVKLYADLGLFTADRRITTEVARVFSFLETVQVPTMEFRHLLVGQFNLRPKLEDLIDYEINQAKEGKEGKITLKMNSLQDPDMVSKLYEASNAGVKITLIVRGVCSLIPGLTGFSENIEAFSIVDRFLEHSRVFRFYHGGDDLIFLSSADWMERNLSRRIETVFPIYDEELKDEIRDILRIQCNDNVKSRMIHLEHTNKYRKDHFDLSMLVILIG
jgi:polyphosphate kinase